MLIGHSGVEKAKIKEILKNKNSKIYFIGIGGISLSALAEFFLKRGHRVFGSDVRRGDSVEHLEHLGVAVAYTHAKTRIYALKPDLVVYSLAIADNNPEYKAAKELSLITVSRAQLLGALIDDFKISFGISGSHGKSTVTAMLGDIFASAGLLPTVFGGAQPKGKSSLCLGNNDVLVYESCEYGDSFLNFSPDYSVLLNMEQDHTDYFPTMEDMKKSFTKAANLAKKGCIINCDCSELRSIIPKIEVPVYTVSANNIGEYNYSVNDNKMRAYSFEFSKKNSETKLEYNLSIPGRFNVTNAALALAAADIMNIPYEKSKEAISSFCGVERRLEFLYRKKTFDVYYDYAHHPTEIRASREALLDMGYNNICVIFAPHTYSRTKFFFNEFCEELSEFTFSGIYEIYGAREAPIVGVTSSSLALEIRNRGGKSRAVLGEDAIEYLLSSNCDCAVLMGAGDLSVIKKKIEEL